MDATLTLTSRLDEVLATSADPPTGEDLDRYRRELAAARSFLEDRKGRIKKLGGASRAPR